MRLNKVNVEFKIYWTAALQRDNILLTEKRREEGKLIQLQLIINYKLENYIMHNMH